MMVVRTFHAQITSSCLGGTVFLLGSAGTSSRFSEGWSFSPSKTGGSSRARGCGSSPKSNTAGIPFLRHRNLSVNRGPISWSATFSVDLKAYLESKNRWAIVWTSYGWEGAQRTDVVWRTGNRADCAEWQLVDLGTRVAGERLFETFDQQHGRVLSRNYLKQVQDDEV